MSTALTPNGSRDLFHAHDLYGIFAVLFRDGYFLANIGETTDEAVQQIARFFGSAWHEDAAIMTIEKKEDPRFVGHSDGLIEAHNECAYTVHPPRLLALYCVENDAENGAFFVVDPIALMPTIGQHYLPSLRGARYACQVTQDTAPFQTTLMRSTALGERIVFSSIGAATGRSIYTLELPVDEHSAHLVPHLAAVLNDPANRRIHRWKRGDLLVVDNLRLMHGREAFSGHRVLRHLRLR